LVGDWEPFFQTIFSDNEIIVNLNTVNEYYKFTKDNMGPKIYPEQKNVFRAFKECPYRNLSVVILLQDPYYNGSATGIALANESRTPILSASLQIVKDTVSKTIYHGHNFDFDPSLKKWANQGILLLNTALTVEEGKPGSHIKLWSVFTKKLLQKLSYTNSGITYCLWGGHAKNFIGDIYPVSNTILTSSHPINSAYKNVEWDCDHFVKIREHLLKFNNIHIIW
jgi:uracil-DNA glycosylase